MLPDNKVDTNDNKQLPDVFKELKRIRSDQVIGQETYDNTYGMTKNNFLQDLKSKSIWKTVAYGVLQYLAEVEDFVKEIALSVTGIFGRARAPSIPTIPFHKRHRIEYDVNQIMGRQKQKSQTRSILRDQRKPIIIGIIISVFLGFFIINSTSNYILATDVSVNAEEAKVVGNFEENNNTIDLMGIISDNISVTTKKEITIEEQQIDFTVTHNANKTLPKEEMVVLQQGAQGRKEITFVRTFENDEVVNEKIINENILLEPVEEIIDVGTSEFLAEYQIHLGDTIYAAADIVLKTAPADDATELGIIKKNLDMKLVEIAGENEEWSNVTFGHYNGYIKNNRVTSAEIQPEVVELCRLTKITMKVDFNMDLNVQSGLLLRDFQKILSNDLKDVNKIFENNAEVFYNMEMKYNINGIFLAAIGIHESAWGTSNISKVKKNLFGYGAYDSNPMGGAYTFETYEEGIDLVARALVKNYINIGGIIVYDQEISTGAYYNGPNVSGVNIRYASDTEWAQKVYTVMEYLYSKL